MQFDADDVVTLVAFAVIVGVLTAIVASWFNPDWSHTIHATAVWARESQL